MSLFIFKTSSHTISIVGIKELEFGENIGIAGALSTRPYVIGIGLSRYLLL